MVCRKCQEDKDASRFHPSYPRRCKSCLAQDQREYRKKRPRDYWQHKDKQYALKKRYGITLQQYEEMIASQDGRCAICRQTPEEGGSTSRHMLLHVDHDHETGKVRELLCNGCNRALGFINDDPLRARLLAVYLEKHSEAEGGKEDQSR